MPAEHVEPIAPAVATRVRIRYAKTGVLRFTSALDLGRVFERALRRADLPIAYSEGFSPHPKVSFADALPLGYASTGEYVELAFAGPVDVQAAAQRLDDAFPTGLGVVTAIGVADGAPKLAARLRASVWQLDWDDAPSGLGDAVAAILEADRVPVMRSRTGPARPAADKPAVEVDLRPAIHLFFADARSATVALHAVEPPVRPTEVELALSSVLGAPLPPPALTTRVVQGLPVADGVEEALTGAVVLVGGAGDTPAAPEGPRGPEHAAAAAFAAAAVTPGAPL